MPETLHTLRVVATPSALDQLDPGSNPLMRLAPDEALLLTDRASVEVSDSHAVVESDTGWVVIRSDVDTVQRFLSATADFALGDADPGFTQGMAAGLAVKLWRDGATCLVVTTASAGEELDDRFWREVTP